VLYHYMVCLSGSCVSGDQGTFASYSKSISSSFFIEEMTFYFNNFV